MGVGGAGVGVGGGLTLTHCKFDRRGGEGRGGDGGAPICPNPPPRFSLRLVRCGGVKPTDSTEKRLAAADVNGCTRTLEQGK